MSHFLFILVGVSLLTVGGEALIRGSLAVSVRLRVSPLLSGLVIVGFGTSAPELVVSVNAALNQQPDIAIGNVVGSNIGNILLILGVCAVITPMTIKPLALRRDAVTVVAASLLFLIFAATSALGRIDGVILLAALLAYLVWAYNSERAETAAAQLNIAEAKEVHSLPKSIAWTVTAVLIGLVLLIAGSQILLVGAVGIAKSIGVSEAVIGLTLVAVGTSLPELSISLIAALRRHADVAVGNILGSNIFNLLGILGVSALLQPLPIHARVLQFDQWVMLAASLLLLLFLSTGRQLSRVEGGLLLLGYAGYLGLSFTVFTA
jgi:cation:H+ antiporter